MGVFVEVNIISNIEPFSHQEKNILLRQLGTYAE